MVMIFLRKKQSLNVCYVLASATAYLLSSASLALTAPFPSGGYTSGSGAAMPLKLFDIAAEADRISSQKKDFTFSNLMKYSGFVGAHRDAYKDTVSQWIFPENPTELQWRPLFLVMDSSIIRVQFDAGRGIRFGYIVDGNIIARNNAKIYCESPGIVADGRLVTSGGGSAMIQQNSRVKINIESFFSGVQPVNAHLITSAKVVEYTTCGMSASGPKRAVRLTTREHQQFKKLIGYLADVTGNPHLKAATAGKAIR
jgi:hypothetical protein